MTSSMAKVSSLVSKDIGNYLTNKQTWGNVVYNVDSYGATGDGTTDNTGALQASFDAGAGNTVLFPPGTYIISDTLVVPSGTTLMCFIKGGAVIKASASFPSNKPLIWNEVRTGTVDTYYDENISIINIAFDGNNNAGRTNSLVAMLKAKNLTFDGCSFRNTSYMGASIGGCFDVTFDGCYATATGNPVFTSEGGAAIWVAHSGDGSKSKNVKIIRSTFEDLEWAGVYFMPDGGIIDDCDFRRCKEAGIFANNTGRNLRFVNNFITLITRKYISSSGIESGARDVVISDNIINYCQNAGISLTDPQNVVVTDNEVMNNGQDNVTYSTVAGIGIITISASPNQPKHVQIKNNRVGDNQTVKTQLYGVAVVGPGDAAEYIEIIENDLEGNATSEFDIDVTKWGVGCRTNNANQLTDMEQQFIINGNFNEWNRGTSFTNPASVDMVADRFQLIITNSGSLPSTIVHSQQAITPGDLPGSSYAYRINVNGAGSGFGVNDNYVITNKVEYGTRLLCGAGKKVTISFWAKSDIVGKKLGVFFSQQYGNGGSPSAAEVIQGKTFDLTSTWQKFTITVNTNTLAGKTFGTNNNDILAINFVYMWGGTYASTRLGTAVAETFVGAGNIDIAQIKGNSGDTVLHFNPKSPGQDKLDCQRYAIVLRDATNSAIPIGEGHAISTTVAHIHIDLGQDMRTAPTLTATATDWSLSDGVTTTALTAISILSNSNGTRKLTLVCTVAAGLTQFRPYRLIANAADKKMIFSADL